jgi:hypothetical protein
VILTDFVTMSISRRWRWAGNVAHVLDMKNPHKMLVGEYEENIQA